MPVRRRGQFGGERLTVERPELAGGEPECLGVQGHVSDHLAEVPGRRIQNWRHHCACTIWVPNAIIALWL